MDIALIGGHGKVALLAAPLLVEAGHTVHSVIRNPEHSAEVEATGAHAVLADIETLDAAGWDELLRGKDAVVWSAGAGGGDPRRTRAVDQEAAIASMDAAQRVGAVRYVMISYFGASLDHGVPEDEPFHAYAEAKAQADAHLRGTQLSWTILGPSGLTLEEPTGRIDLGAAEAGSVSRGNVARTIVAALERPGTAGRFLAYNDGEQEIGAAFDAVR
ncbi:oxidoreductase ylbE [Brachybacterium faecium]|uniref:Putative NADH-flavin reductase n=1 Tax=Brachybacterium faecium (strain ATCC 43885 / DSM 4810 / JCM 11609 / LMG 19847 / NBRC 14762 / NCIMB 9860 / 6-10) TaxID=446465 RepID=C7MEM5_BRAFD|nr:SDR family oxidoreductase [Brachybacterium faecium]ACU86025.1 putative NADH-flavin reductase [Brachybacterium faecium DSM 4810]SLM96206.1 oxidoreductase ylbE [Brachybacterium faecium]